MIENIEKMCDNIHKQMDESSVQMEKHKILEHYYGYREFRPGQEELIDGVLAGRDVFGIMPTGGGKSIC